MFRRKFWIVAWTARLVLALLLTGGIYLVYRAGWSEGWDAARLAVADGAVSASATRPAGLQWVIGALVAIVVVSTVRLITHRWLRRRFWKQHPDMAQRREQWLRNHHRHGPPRCGMGYDEQPEPETQGSPAPAA